MKNSKRITLKSLAISSVAIGNHVKWATPLATAVSLPAHAQTSLRFACSSTVFEQVNLAISITIVAGEVRGPIAVTLNGSNFSGSETVNSGTCNNGTDSLTQETEFSGSIDSSTSTITGTFNVRQLCGGLIACEQLAQFSAVQDPVVSNSDEGTYIGSLTGTLQCCPDFV